MQQRPPIFSLLQVANSIKKTLSQRYTSSFWVKAEMNKLNFYKHSGHCYPELVEKENGKVIALVNGILWKNDFLRANQSFLDILKEPLKDGIKILFLAKIVFEPSHGLALQILDIDPGYTMGDLEREKQETIARLQAEGIFSKNKLLAFPQLPQRIAIISVETSKGYADFLSVINGNQWNYAFYHHLFPSLLQGEKAVDGIISQLNRIRKVLGHFDVVAIIRGGGGDVGLSCYNNYKLAKAIADFPLPVLTGIGHATNETVSELISHRNAITPTKLADFLLQRFHETALPVQRAKEIIKARVSDLITREKSALLSETRLFRSAAKKMISSHKNTVLADRLTVIRQAQAMFSRERDFLSRFRERCNRGISVSFFHGKAQLKSQVELIRKNAAGYQMRNLQSVLHLERHVEIMHPDNVLKRGYSITLKNGRAVTSSDELSNGDLIQIKFLHGEIQSQVTNTDKKI